MSKSESVLGKSRAHGDAHNAEIRSCPASSGCGDKTREAFDYGSYLGNSNPYRPLSHKHSKATMEQLKRSPKTDLVDPRDDSSNSWRNFRLFRLFSCCSHPPASALSDDNLVASVIVMPGNVRIKETWTPGESLPQISQTTTTSPAAPQAQQPKNSPKKIPPESS